MTDDEFAALCEKHGFGAVARGEFPLIPPQMLRALLAAAVAQAIEACAKLCEEPGLVEDRDGLEEAARRIRATLPRTDQEQAARS